jgi:hypothetical protein
LRSVASTGPAAFIAKFKTQSIAAGAADPRDRHEARPEGCFAAVLNRAPQRVEGWPGCRPLHEGLASRDDLAAFIQQQHFRAVNANGAFVPHAALLVDVSREDNVCGESGRQRHETPTG